MSKFFIYIGDMYYEVRAEAAPNAFNVACKFGDATGQKVCLVDGETGEILAEHDNLDYEPADIDDDCGFDPDMGCISHDG